MSLFAILTFFVAMVSLAALPSSSVALVVIRSASLGLVNGFATILGIVIADCLFLLIAILGMSALASSLGAFFMLLKFLAGGYLIWLGVQLWRSPQHLNLTHYDLSHRTLFSSFMAGLLLTLGDIKAIFFYASLLPMLMSVQHLAVLDTAMLLVITMVTVGGVKVVYAIFARRIIARLQQHQGFQHGHKVAGGALVGVGTYVVVNAG